MSIFLETKRLIIKNPSLEYLTEAFLLDSDSVVMRFMGGSRTLPSAREWLEKCIHHQNEYGFSFGFVYHKKTEIFLGRAGLLCHSYHDSYRNVEIAYRFHQIFWGYGYAIEVAKALIEWGFVHLSIDKIVATVHPENKKSQRVLEKIGMNHVGRHKYKEYDDIMDLYEILRS